MSTRSTLATWPLFQAMVTASQLVSVIMPASATSPCQYTREPFLRCLDSSTSSARHERFDPAGGLRLLRALFEFGKCAAGKSAKFGCGGVEFIGVVGAARLPRGEPASKARELIWRQLDDGFGDFFNFHVAQYIPIGASELNSASRALEGRSRESGGRGSGVRLSRFGHATARRQRLCWRRVWPIPRAELVQD